MATFTNRATLTYRGGTTVSNTVTGTVNETLTLEKTALIDSYDATSRLVYVLSLNNSGGVIQNLTLTDDLGGFDVAGVTRYPLTYVDSSLKYFVNGEVQTTPAVTGTEPLVISGVSIPAGGSAVLVYEADVSEFAPLTEGSTIVNTVTVGGIVAETLTASETVSVTNAPSLSITKSLTPVSVGSDGALTYTFVIENRGNTAAVATDDLTVQDTFDPILTLGAVLLNDTVLQEGTGYTYNETSGEFATVPSVITVPAATFEVNPDGSVTVIPGRTVLTVSGTIN